MPRFCLALDLKDDADLIAAYKAHHQDVWPEIQASIRSAGVEAMDIYSTGNRLFMIMEVAEGFSFENKAAMDAGNPTVQKWEALMDTFQQRLPHTPAGEKWVRLDRIFSLDPA